MNRIVNTASLAFIVTVLVMTVVAILGVWDFLVEDVITKSLITVGFFAFVSVVAMWGYRLMHSDESDDDMSQQHTWQPMFRNIRLLCLRVLILGTVILGLVGGLGIWEVIESDALWRSFSSIIIIALSAGVIAAVCFEREGRGVLTRMFKNHSGGWSFVSILIAIVVLAILIEIVS